MRARTYDTYRIVDTSSHRWRVFDLRRQQVDVFQVLVEAGRPLLVGVSFEWAHVASKHRFSSAQFVTFAGSKRARADENDRIDTDARQLLRLEWQGRGNDGAFEAKAAGHPHWQVDHMPSPPLAALSTPPRVMELTDLAKTEQIQPKSWMSRLHLAAAASGWAGSLVLRRASRGSRYRPRSVSRCCRRDPRPATEPPPVRRR